MTDPTPPASEYTDTDEELAMATAYIADLTAKLAAAEKERDHERAVVVTLRANLHGFAQRVADYSDDIPLVASARAIAELTEPTLATPPPTTEGGET